MKKFSLFIFLLLSALHVAAQVPMEMDQYNQLDDNGNLSRRGGKNNGADTLGTDKEIPKGLWVWTVDRRFGDRINATPDTLSHMFPNTIFTTGLRGEYNSLGNLGSPRQARIFIDRQDDGQFIFTQPYDFFLVRPENFHFTNTLSPITNVSYNTCGDRTDGEDHLTAKFAVNANKRLGMGFNFDYLYGRGYYANQASSHFNYTMYGSYLGDRYQAHILMSTNHQKLTENGGITDDNYITHPESYNDSYQTTEIPTILSNNWNRNDNQHVFFTQRYSLGFNRKVPMTPDEIKAKKFAMAAQKDQEEREARKRAEENGEDYDQLKADQERNKTFAGRPDNAAIATTAPAKADSASQDRITVTSKAMADSLIAAENKAKEDTSWMKNEYVPVTSFIHTLELNNYRRIYQAYETPASYYHDTYDVYQKWSGDSIYDKTSHLALRNTFAISLLEGFNKWAKAGLKAFISHELRHFTLPDSTGSRSWNENALSVGGELTKREGKTLHYHVLGEVGIGDANSGEIHVDGGVDLNFPLFRDTVTLAASGFFHHEKPLFYFRHYNSRHFHWDDDNLDMSDHLRVQGIFRYQKTRTQLRVAVDQMKNYTYFATTYTDGNETRTDNAVTVAQSSDINILTAELTQDFTLGPLNWETVLTYQNSSDKDVLPLPSFNVYSNLYLRFKIAKVLNCDFGADVRYFTKYNAPAYVPGIGQFAVQANEEKIEIGNYPIVNAYLNFTLKHTRFFVMMSHINAGSGKKNYFYTPHYALNGRLIRFGVSWTFND